MFWYSNDRGGEARRLCTFAHTARGRCDFCGIRPVTQLSAGVHNCTDTAGPPRLVWFRGSRCRATSVRRPLAGLQPASHGLRATTPVLKEVGAEMRVCCRVHQPSS